MTKKKKIVVFTKPSYLTATSRRKKGRAWFMKRWKLQFVFVIVVSCCLLICGLKPVFAAQSTADVVVSDTQKEQLRKEIVGNAQLPGEQQEYVIGHGDVLSVSVYGEDDMAASAPAGARSAASGPVAGGGGDVLRHAGNGVEVRLDGRVSLKHIGDVQLAGMTLTQAADYLKKLYLTVFDDPIVTVVLVQSNSRRYTVMGQVIRPGIFYLDFPVTIIQAIARSGGFNEWANHDVTIIRQGSGPALQRKKEKKTLTFDYDDFLKGKNLEENIYLQPNDVMIVH
jgi:polysaccharide export outer membrane protein